MMYSRKSPRADFHNYSCGNYFVTICTCDKKHYFGEIINGEMHFTTLGEFCREALGGIESHYQYVEVPVFIVMPNHVHAIIGINDSADAPPIRAALSVIIGGFKQKVTMFARRNNIEFAWQARYHDHIIRNSCDGNNISDYIKTNVERWANDIFFT